VNGTRILKDKILEVPRARLKVARGKNKGRALELGEPTVAVIGTHPDADLILDDDTVSRRHAELCATEAGWLVRDLGSTNGVRVDGTRVVAAILDRSSHSISLGETDLEWKRLDDAAAHALSPRVGFGLLLGESPPMRALYAILERAAPSDSTLLIEGESGTGKEAVAESVHRASARNSGPFVVVDCGAIAANLLESELFGHEKGAFTGADRARPGAVEEAEGGTLFLDEIGELPIELQPKLLRLLESKQVRRLGAAKHRSIDVRVVCATHRKLDRCVAEGSFRQDLYYRLAVVKVTVPPLRARAQDIMTLARHFALAQRKDVDPDSLLTEGVKAAFRAHSWPGNVRELRNAVERLMLVGELDTNVKNERPRPYHEARAEAIDRFEREYCKTLLTRAGGVVSKAAGEAGISRQMFHRLLGKHGVDV
jgi:transcriptional regulator with PAS, ATPase and Fis domain